MPVQTTIPLGAVTSFAGDLTVAAIRDEVLAAGWLPCDGTSYSTSDYAELFAAIGTSNGGAGNTFNVPQLSNRMARGADGGTGNDPDAATRIAAAPGGATGANVGSLQPGGTGLPNRPWPLSESGSHQHSYDRVNTDMKEAWGGTWEDAARWSDTTTVDTAGAHSHTITGGDPVTMPKNLALYWVIHAKQVNDPGAAAPGGSICGVAATVGTVPASWLSCDGMAQAVGTPPSALAEVIGYNYGGDGTSVFDLPDFRGRFQRGTSHGVNLDPDADARGPSQTGGNVGDAVGSLQRYATGNPRVAFAVATTGDHVHNCPRVAGDAHNAAYGASGPAAWNIMRLPDNATTTTSGGAHTHGWAGGDAETRPENICLDWLIAADDIGDAPPVGSVMAFAGDVTDLSIQAGLLEDGWYPCAGGTLKKNAANQALYAVIGDTYTARPNPLTFTLPDLRGLFVVGAGTRALGAEQGASTTAMPVKPFLTTTDGDHNHQITGTYTDDQKVDIVEGWSYVTTKDPETPSSTAGAHIHTIDTVNGGDAESRPLNVYVDYIIRFR